MNTDYVHIIVLDIAGDEGYLNIHHRITEPFGLEGTFKGHLVQRPCSERGHLQLDRVAQGPLQSDFECFHGWGIDHFSRQPVPVFHHPHCKKDLLYTQSKCTLFQFKTIAPCPIATGPAKMFVPVNVQPHQVA